MKRETTLLKLCYFPWFSFVTSFSSSSKFNCNPASIFFAQDKAADREIAYLRAVIRCLSSFRVECDYTPKNLLLLIDQLKKQKQDRKVLGPTAAPAMAPKKELDMKRRAADLEDQPKQQDAKKRPRFATPLTTPNKPQQQDAKKPAGCHTRDSSSKYCTPGPARSLPCQPTTSTSAVPRTSNRTR